MTFYEFMMRNYFKFRTLDEDNKIDAYRANPRGDLAFDIYTDRDNFPRNGAGQYDTWHDRIRCYLMNRGACKDCLDTFEDCWKEYVKYVEL